MGVREVMPAAATGCGTFIATCSRSCALDAPAPLQGSKRRGEICVVVCYRTRLDRESFHARPQVDLLSRVSSSRRGDAAGRPSLYGKGRQQGRRKDVGGLENLARAGVV